MYCNNILDGGVVCGSSLSLVVCELFLFYLRGVSFGRVIVSRNVPQHDV
jgi:hypothetical protein